VKKREMGRRRNLNDIRNLKYVEMDENRYEEDGEYAAEVDFKRSEDYLLKNVIMGFGALVQSVGQGGSGIEGHEWEGKYIETGLKLSGYEEVALLLRKDLDKAADAFTKCLEEKDRKEKLKRARGFGGARGFGKKQRVGKRIDVVEKKLKEQLAKGGEVLFERNNEFGHVSVLELPDGRGGVEIKINLFGDINEPSFLEYVEEVKSLFPEAMQEWESI
jgi:hypothetical protein